MRIPKSSGPWIAAALCFGSAVWAENRLEESRFSFAIPRGWQARSVSGMKYRIVVGPAGTGGYAPSITVSEQRLAGGAEQYADAAERGFSLQEGYRSRGRSRFTTDGGLVGVRLAGDQTRQGTTLRQLAYFFPGRGTTKFVVSATAAVEDGSRLEKTLDASMKTFTPN